MDLSSPLHLRPAHRGHTFIELLVVLMVLGIMSSIGLFAYQGHLRDAVVVAHDRRIAQEIASECQRSAAAGVDVFRGESLGAAVLNLIDGVEAEDGIFKGRIFKVILPTKDDFEGALNYLEVRGGDVYYLP